MFVGTALLGLLLGAGSSLWWDELSGKLVLIAALLYVVGTFGVTMVFNQPMNLRLAALAPSQALAYRAQYVDTWTRWNHVRTAASLLSAAVFVAALLLQSGA